MKIAVQVWNDYFSKLLKVRIPGGLRTAVVLILALVGLIFAVRACSAHFLWEPPIYRIAIDKTWYPIQLFDKERNMQAFASELLLAIAKKENIRIEIFFAGSDNMFLGLNNSQFDGVLSPLQPGVFNRESYIFSDPFYKLGAVLVVSDSSNVKSLSDMGGKIIGIRSDASLVFNINQFPEIILKSYDNSLIALMDLEKNTIDGVILDALSASIYTSGIFAKRLKIVGSPLTDIGLRLITRHNQEKLIEHFNAGLKALKSNGTYNEMIYKWGLFNPEIRGKVDSSLKTSD